MGDGSTRFAPPFPEGLDIVHFSSADIGAARNLLHRFYRPVALDVPEGPAAFGFGARVIQLGPLTVGQLSYATAVNLVAPQVDAYHVTMPTTGRTRTRFAGHEVVATPVTAAIFGPEGPVRAEHEARSAELAIRIERSALEEELAALLGHPIEGPLGLAPVIGLADGAGQSWSRLIRLLRNELDHEVSLLHQPLIAEQLRSCVLSGLLLSVPHRYRDQLTGPAPAGPPRAIRRAVEAVHDEPERAFTVGDLAAIANMSVRSLQEGFRQHVGSAPMTYLQSVRLERARESLRRAGPRITVAAVAHRWGFAHLGRFACAYRRRFGESPSDTLRRT